MSRDPTVLLCLAWRLALAPGGAVARAAEAPVDFARGIAPIFAARCTSCHGPDRQRAALRLDVFKPALVKENLLVPGQPDRSEIFRLLICSSTSRS